MNERDEKWGAVNDKGEKSKIENEKNWKTRLFGLRTNLILEKKP